MTLSVTNGGDPISDDAMERLFQPFSVARFAKATRGLGLGLHIASEIARAHGGAIMVNSADQEIVFTFTMPTASV